MLTYSNFSYSNVYGFIHGINRNKPTTQQVVADSWPDFKVIICRPDPMKCTITNQMTMELTEDQLKVAEIELEKYLPRSQQMYGFVVLRNRVKSDPAQIFVDKWPHFSVVFCKPFCKQENDPFRIIFVFATNEAVLEETIRKSSLIDWTTYFGLGINNSHMEIFKKMVSEKNVPCRKISVCHRMRLEDISKLPPIDSSGISLSSLDESHIGLVSQTWKFVEHEGADGMIHRMISNFPSCCVLDADGRPVSWILTYNSCAMGMLYTLLEHRGKGYAKVLISSMAKRHHALGLPVYCFIEEENTTSYRLFTNLGFTEDPSYRKAWFEFN
ncbi:glycine N-acyltransferase isoform X2 [Amphiprion ocellaris]|uniref:glycine N-acyltransferase isoform X2 n=1 Tax=Amphiprion ocellaris TaxID=80972 RepID=UPI0024111C43|nr:glycine N-acyltransferase isoform X2 [Amphiprion ocellaris]